MPSAPRVSRFDPIRRRARGRPAHLGYSVLGVSVRRPVCAVLAWLPTLVGQGAFWCRHGIDLFTGRPRKWAGGIDFPFSGCSFQFRFNHLRRVASESHYRCPGRPHGARGQTRSAAADGGRRQRRPAARQLPAAPPQGRAQDPCLPHHPLRRGAPEQGARRRRHPGERGRRGARAAGAGGGARPTPGRPGGAGARSKAWRPRERSEGD